MPATRQSKDETFNFRVDPALKAAFTSAAEAQERPAAQVLRDFMRAYVRAREGDAFALEARRQSRMIAAAAAVPGGDEALLLAEMDSHVDTMLSDLDRK
jgi:hypothetical protein